MCKHSHEIALKTTHTSPLGKNDTCKKRSGDYAELIKDQSNP